MRPQNTLFLLVLLVVFSSAVLAEQPQSSIGSQQVQSNSSSVDPAVTPYFLNTYPEFEGYTITSQSRRGDMERVDYHNGEVGLPDSSSVAFNNRVILDLAIFPRILERTLSLWSDYVEFDMAGKGPFYRGERIDSETKFNFLMWISGNRMVSITYIGSCPQTIIDTFLELLPLEPYPFPEPEPKFSGHEKVNLLYTSDDFENPPDYLTMIMKSRAGSAPCVLAGQDSKPASTDVERKEAIRQILFQKKQSVSESEIETMVQECRETGNFTLRGEPIPYDIRACVRDMVIYLAEQETFFTEVDVKQECLIEVYSKENFVRNDGSLNEFEAKLSARRPLVKDLIGQRYADREDCIEDAETNEIVKCTPRTTPTFDPNSLPIDVSIVIQDGLETKTLLIKSDGTEEILNVNGIEVQTDGMIVIENNKILVNNQSIEILPDELPKKLPPNSIIEKAQIISKGETPFYKVQAFIPSKVLFMIPVQMEVLAEIDASSGQTMIQKPWWAFLAG